MFDSKQWYQDTKDVRNTKRREYRRKSRMDALNAYGAKCACCGETTLEFLAIDHVNGGGIKHRKEIGYGHTSSSDLYMWLKRNNYPEGFQILCHNCNLAKGFYGTCPHERNY